MSQWCPPDQTLCCICFACRSEDELYVDSAGQRWDVCAVGVGIDDCARQAGLFDIATHPV